MKNISIAYLTFTADPVVPSIFVFICSCTVQFDPCVLKSVSSFIVNMKLKLIQNWYFTPHAPKSFTETFCCPGSLYYYTGVFSSSNIEYHLWNWNLIFWSWQSYFFERQRSFVAVHFCLLLEVLELQRKCWGSTKNSSWDRKHGCLSWNILHIKSNTTAAKIICIPMSLSVHLSSPYSSLHT